MNQVPSRSQCRYLRRLEAEGYQTQCEPGCRKGRAEHGAAGRDGASCLPPLPPQHRVSLASGTGWLCQLWLGPASRQMWLNLHQGTAWSSDPSQWGLLGRWQGSGTPGPGELSTLSGPGPKGNRFDRELGVCPACLGSSALLPHPHCPDSCPTCLLEVPPAGHHAQCSHNTPELRIFRFQMICLGLTGEDACPGLASGKQKPWTESSGCLGTGRLLGTLGSFSLLPPPPRFL